ncbi:hypothetical protein WJX84_007544 [Apatococcus fuscideae]|uniref:ATP synthase mitochondrial F1 complex assembly factor 2 n=1 Tax=Apatococcus fuscideae TaxID=2026836 RepID=A0AAW1TMJ7_9CHLO
MTLRSPQFTTALQSLYRCIGPQAHLGATHYATAAIDIGAGVSNPAHTAPSNRFYKSVGIRQVEGKDTFEVTLDGRPLKSPARKEFSLPTKSLALAIAAEWEWQDSKRVRPFTMPMMTLASTAIDQPRSPQQVISTLTEWLHTDALCCREQDGPVADLQALAYNPILEWARQELQADIVVSESILGAQQPEDVIHIVSKVLAGLDPWHLTALDALAGACRSVVLGFAVLKGQLKVKDAVAAARLEEEWQMQEWGLVEGGHDIDIADINVRVAAPALFLQHLRR